MVGINSDKIVKSNMTSNQRGFTLIEIMVVVAIVAILVAFAYPNYQNYVVRTKRADMMAEMQQIANRIESRKIAYKTSAKIPINELYGGREPSSSGVIGFPYEASILYDVSIINVDTNTAVTSTQPLKTKWRIEAVPKPTSLVKNDGSLTLNYKGIKCRDIGTPPPRCGTADEWKN